MLQLALCMALVQEQKLKLKQTHKLKLELLQMARVLIVYLEGIPYHIPIRPSVKTRDAKKTGYEYAETDINIADRDCCIASIYYLMGKFPRELHKIVYFMGHNWKAREIMDNITREKILERLQDLILTLVRKGKEFGTNESLYNKWKIISKEVVNEISSLNDIDSSWLSQNYAEWFKSNEEVQNRIKAYPKDFFPTI